MRLVGFAALILLAVAAAGFGVSRVRHRHRMECMNNLRQIDGAIISVALERRYYRGDTIPEAQWTWSLKNGRIPACPSGGHYLIPHVGGYPACSFHGGPFAPGGELYGPPSAKKLGILERPKE
jgi:hypothetical protein